jgi:hypothetical protein
MMVPSVGHLLILALQWMRQCLAIPDTAAKVRMAFMQFTGKKGIALFVVMIIGACIVGLGSGLIVGRQFPAHHFERFGNSSYLLDTSTGKICDLLKVKVTDISKTSVDDYLASKPSDPPACEK